MLDFDLIIIGGGVVGLTLAAILAESNLKIFLLDQQNAPTTGLLEPADIRVSAINHAAQAIFKSIGVWQAMQALRVSPYRKMQVWDANSKGRIDFSASEVGQTFLGHIVEHNVMRQVLWQKLQQHKHVTLRPNCKILALKENNTEVSVILENNELYSAQLLVGADGGHSWVAQHANLAVKARPYPHSALVATIRTEKPHQQTCFERFMPKGPLAFLPLLDPNLSSIVWSTDPKHAAALAVMAPDKFNTDLAKAFEHSLGTTTLLGSCQIFPLTARHAVHYVKARIALIGDAAHTIHPLAGQGVNLGLLDAACLAQVVEEAFKDNRDVGAFYTLRRYERWRKGENTIMLAAMRVLQKLFTTGLPLAAEARALGFTLTSKLPFAKTFFMRRAMGLHGDLPARAVFWSDEL